jgi:hypothetical protein
MAVSRVKRKVLRILREVTRDGPCIVGPANENGCVILCVGNLADEKF